MTYKEWEDCGFIVEYQGEGWFTETLGYDLYMIRPEYITVVVDNDL